MTPQGYDGIKISRNAWDSNFCDVNSKFVAVILEAQVCVCSVPRYSLPPPQPRRYDGVVTSAAPVSSPEPLFLFVENIVAVQLVFGSTREYERLAHLILVRL